MSVCKNSLYKKKDIEENININLTAPKIIAYLIKFSYITFI